LSSLRIIITRSIIRLSRRNINSDITISGGSDIKGVSFGINCDKVTDSRIGDGDISIIKPGDSFAECCCDLNTMVACGCWDADVKTTVGAEYR
jgi:hypothetical protein